MERQTLPTIGNLNLFLHPGRLTWNIQITHLERKMIFQASMIMFHVNLPGCTLRAPNALTQRSSVSPPHPGLLKLGEQQWAILRRQQKEFLITCNERQPMSCHNESVWILEFLFGMMILDFERVRRNLLSSKKFGVTYQTYQAKRTKLHANMWFMVFIHLPVGVLVEKTGCLFNPGWISDLFSWCFSCEAINELIAMSDGRFLHRNYPVIWKILGLFSSPISREIDRP